MPLTAAQLDALLQRLRDSIVDSTDEAVARVGVLADAYNDTIRTVADDLVAGYDRLQAGETVYEVAPGLTPAAAMRGEAIRAVWARFSAHLDTMLDDLAEFRALYGNDLSLGDVDSVLVRTLRGQWPEVRDGRLVGGTGMAGRTYQMTSYHRQELANVVTRNVVGGVDRETSVRAIQAQTDRSRKEAESLFKDASIQFGRAVQDESASDAEWFEYVGPVDSIIREFCARAIDGADQVRRVWSRSEIARMTNNQDSGPVMITAGGYNCRHHWIPVARSWYDDETWELRRASLDQMGPYARE